MSAYVMSAKDLAILARELVDYIEEDRRYGCRPFDKYTEELDALPNGTDKVEYTYRKLYSLNLQGVNCRYGENNNEIPAMPRLMPKGDEPWSPIQIIKKIRCWQYQSCEDDEIFGGQFYREMSEWAGRLALGVITLSDAYSNAEW